MYESPLSRIYGEIQTKIIEHEENQILQAVQNCGITVDKEELTRALMYDRQQYEKGYADAKAEQRWIPVSERLPEKNGVYIVSYEDAVTWLEWFNGKWFFYPSNPAREETGTITAWMPLPEPYRGE